MKKITRQTLDELAKTLPVISEEEQKSYVGGQSQSCVFNCFDYLDGDRRTADDYFTDTLINLSYVPDDRGGVPTSDIGKIGAFGGFKVEEITTPVPITGNGLTSDGCNVMMTFNDKKTGIDHAVVVTGVIYREGKPCLKYHDPTNNEDGYREMSDYSALYKVDYQPSDTSLGGSGIQN